MRNHKELSTHELMKLLGLKSEQKIRDLIKHAAKDEETINLVKKVLHKHVHSIQQHKRNSEVLSQLLNFPTKNDIANIAKLGVQIEEKLDSLDEHLRCILQHSITEKKPPSITNTIRISEKEKEKRRKLDVIMNLIQANDNEKLLDILNNRVKRRD